MVVSLYPGCNRNVKESLMALSQAGLLESFHTTVDFSAHENLIRLLPTGLSSSLRRRSYPCPSDRIITYPLQAMARFLYFYARSCLPHQPYWRPSYWSSIDSLLDQSVAGYIREQSERTAQQHSLKAIYGYENVSSKAFAEAKRHGLKCIYDLTTPYWAFSQDLARTEAVRNPEWERTITFEPPARVAQKTQEIELADTVLCISKLVKASIPEKIRQDKRCVIVDYGCDFLPSNTSYQREYKQDEKLRVLFVGNMNAMKGLPDIFAAIRLLGRKDIELIVLGQPWMPMSFYRQQCDQFTYHPPCAHSEVFQLMETCDVFLFPSLIEGRGLVQLEALSCGLPVISTVNATGDDFIEEGINGFIVPIRSPEAIAEKLTWFLDNRNKIGEMSVAARASATQRAWEDYRSQIVQAVTDTVGAQ